MYNSCKLNYFAFMEFKATVENQLYIFTSISTSSYLVTGQDNSYILYKSSQWQCADLIPGKLLKKLGEVIEEQTGSAGTY